MPPGRSPSAVRLAPPKAVEPASAVIAAAAERKIVREVVCLLMISPVPEKKMSIKVSLYRPDSPTRSDPSIPPPAAEDGEAAEAEQREGRRLGDLNEERAVVRGLRAGAVGVEGAVAGDPAGVADAAGVR